MYNKVLSSKILLSLFTWFTLNTVFRSEQHLFPSRKDIFQCSFCLSNLIQKFQTDWCESSTHSSIVIQKSCSIDYPVSCHPHFTTIMSQLSSHIIIYFILGFKSFSPKFLVKMSANCWTPSHQSILCIFQLSTFPKKWTLLAMWFVFLVSLH